MITRLLYILFLLTTTLEIFGQHLNLKQNIDSLIKDSKFNGVILISEKGKTKYVNTFGYADFENKNVLKSNDQFVIGSISKQFTAVLVLREYDKGRLDLHTPIRKYLPELKQSWADTVTVHHLLTHTHGINEPDQPALFKIGTQYAYSQIGYDLLAKIVERTSGKSFSDLSAELFRKCKMTRTFHPERKEYKNLVKGYTEQEDGLLLLDSLSLMNYPAAGSFISTANDLSLWNRNLHNGKLLKSNTYTLMTAKQKNAIRQHPVFGITAYGYGITVGTKDNILQLGQTGMAPGFVSMNFYLPQTKTSIIVLENIAYNTNDLKKTFFHHTEILNIIRNEKFSIYKGKAGDRPKISFTFDDGSTQDFGGYKLETWNQSILDNLQKHNVKAILFSSGHNKASARGKYVLSSWNDTGHKIGNHTFSHPDFNNPINTIETFNLELSKNDSLINSYSNYYPYFRFPYLKEGNTPEKVNGFREVLKEKGYKNGHVTVDASDWYIDSRLVQRLKENARGDISGYRDYYINHIFNRAQYYDSLAYHLTKRRISHVLLLHHNLAAALFLDDLIQHFEDNGWEIIDADKAYQDEIFKEVPDRIPAGESLIWSLAKRNGKYEKVLRYPAEDSRYEKPLMDNLGL